MLEISSRNNPLIKEIRGLNRRKKIDGIISCL